MKAAPLTPFAARVLKIVGLILIVASLLDYIILSVPFQLQDKQWLLNYITQVVDRGIIPLVGLAFLFTGLWIENELAGQGRGRSIWSLSFWALALSTALGLIFLLLVPLHLNTTRLATEDALKQLDQNASVQESQLDAQVKQRESQISSLLQNEQQVRQLDQQLKQLETAISSGQLKGPQLEQAKRVQQELQQLRANPGSLGDKAKEFRNQELLKIRDGKQKAEQQIRGQSWKTGLRIGLSSLLLALAYSIVGWSGLREQGFFQSGRRRASVSR